MEFFSNLAEWTALINEKVEKVLVSRLQLAIKVWIDEFLLTQDADQLIELPSKQHKLRSKRSTMLLKDSSAAKSPLMASIPEKSANPLQQQQQKQQEVNSKPVIHLLVHEIRMKNQTMFIDPPLEDARARWYSMFQEWVANACTLKKIQASRYEMGLNISSSSSSSSGYPEDLTYTSLLSAVADTSLKNAYHAIESKLLEVSKYVSSWLQYQSLWDMDTEYVLNSLGDDLEKWQQMVADIKKSRSTFDNSGKRESEKGENRQRKSATEHKSPSRIIHFIWKTYC